MRRRDLEDAELVVVAATMSTRPRPRPASLDTTTTPTRWPSRKGSRPRVPEAGDARIIAKGPCRHPCLPTGRRTRRLPALDRQALRTHRLWVCTRREWPRSTDPRRQEDKGPAPSITTTRQTARLLDQLSASSKAATSRHRRTCPWHPQRAPVAASAAADPADSWMASTPFSRAAPPAIGPAVVSPTLMPRC